MEAYHYSGKRFGSLIIKDGGEVLSLSLRLDNSCAGCYSVVMKNKAGRSSSDRMRYEGGMLISELIADYQEYLNIDNDGCFEVKAI